jgi:hypothetical protein
MLPSSERKLRASLAGLTGWANTVDRSARGVHASRGLYEKFDRATDPTLPDDVRAKMADCAFRAHMKRLTLKSATARRLRKEAQERQAQERREARQAATLDGGAA